MRKMVVLVALAALGVGVAATAAGAVPPKVSITSCGQVITTNAVLRTDLVCSGNALTIAASDVTVRLEGHRITSSDGAGVGIQFGGPSTCTSASCLPGACVSNVAVRDGTISGFLDAITGSARCGSGGPSLTGDAISGLTLTNNTWGVYLHCEFSLAIDHVTMVGPNGIGPLAMCPGEVAMSNSTIDVTSPTGVNVFTTNTSTIDSSRLDGGSVGPGPTSALMRISKSRLIGVALDCGDSTLVVLDSHLDNSRVSGAFTCGETFARDRFVGPGSGIALDLESANYPVSIVDSSFSGWSIAIQIHNAWDLSITGSTFRHNGNAVATCTSGGCDGNGTISDNRFVANTGTGILLDRGTWNIGSNLALRNGGLAIDAERTPESVGGHPLVVIDNGGNIARHNQPPQCIGVVCTR